jgi:hypothetical protein
VQRTSSVNLSHHRTTLDLLYLLFREGTAETGLGRRADARNRSVRVRNIPSGTQEGLLHQLLEKHSLVKRTEIFAALNEAVVELENPAVGVAFVRSAESY